MSNKLTIDNGKWTIKNKIPSERGFTLVEMLVVISLLSIVGVIILTIFSRTLKGSNKAQIIAVIKENGQSVLENMDKTIRNSDSVFCTNNSTIVVNSGNIYTRYKFITNAGLNGYIQREVFAFANNDTQAISQSSHLCIDYTDVNITPVKLTDDNSQTGVSVESGAFSKNHSPGFADQVTISFQVKPGKGAPASIAGQVDAATFQTTIELWRN